MCEVNSCCCLTLRQGCIIIGGITILVSLVQTMIFTWVLVETFQSSLSYQPSIETNSSGGESSSSTYSFDSPRCPFGFLPLTTKSSNNDSTEEEEEEEAEEYPDDTEVNLTMVLSEASTPESPKSAPDGSTPSPSQDLELTPGDEEPTTAVPSAKLMDPSRQDVVTIDKEEEEEEEEEEQLQLLSSTAPSTVSSPSLISNTSSTSSNDSFLVIDPSSLSVSSARETMYASRSSFRTLNKTRIVRIKCAAPGQGLLWVLVVASALYTLVGVLLIFAISYCVSWQLSIWFFYTVGYNLFLIIVAMTDGNYTSLPDISSYVVFVVMTYCIIVVDSYYEKQLLQDERADKSGQPRRRSSLVIVRSSPDTPTSAQPDYIPPTSYRVSTNHNLAPPPAHNLAPPAHNLRPPPAHTLAPPPVNLGHPMKLAPPPTRPPAYHQAPPDRSKDYALQHHTYHSNNL